MLVAIAMRLHKWDGWVVFQFLSAIMRRQYVEALKYCRLILQYEPHNSTARGFYPLLQHKVARAQHTGACGLARHGIVSLQQTHA